MIKKKTKKLKSAKKKETVTKYLGVQPPQSSQPTIKT